MKKIIVSDITLKVIEQLKLPLTFREKLSIAENLDLTKVDAIELPLLKNSKENEVICRTIATSIKNAMVKIPVGDTVESVKMAYDCVKGAKNCCLQVVLPISTVQMEYFYHLKSNMMIDKISQLVKTAKQYCENVEFVALDAFRAEEGFLNSCVATAVENGAKSIIISDDEGNALVEDYAKMVNEIKTKNNVELLVLPSNKLSLAVACAIESVRNGVDGIVTSTIGEYMSLSALSNVFREKRYNLGMDCNIDLTKSNTLTGEISVGLQEKSEEVAENKVSGVVESSATLNDIVRIIKNLGYEISDADCGKVYEEFKRVTAKKEAIDIKEFEAIVATNVMQVSSTYHLVSFVVNSSNIIPATANVVLERDGEKLTGVSSGDGPIDAAFHAIEQIVGHHYELDDFQVQAVTKGRGAVGSSLIRLRANGKLYPGNGVSTDIIGACIRAYINALNKIVYEGK